MDSSSSSPPSGDQQLGATEDHEALDADYIAATFNANPVFDAELLTPEYSDNLMSDHTTPQEQIWKDQFTSYDSSHLDATDHDFSTLATAAPVPRAPTSAYSGTSSALEANLPQYVSVSQLLSPQLTIPSPPEMSRQLSHQGDTMISPIAPQQLEGQHPTQHALTADALNLSQTSGYHISTSPIVIVSSHNPGGDSPAPAIAPRSRSASKRGREDAGLQATYATDGEDDFSDHNSARLMPPQPFEATHLCADPADERAGLSPSERRIEQVASINELAQQRELDERNAGVEEWLSKSEAGSVTGDTPNETISPSGRRGNHRPRAHTTGAWLYPTSTPFYPDHHIPGPGALIDELSDDGLSYDGSATSILESPPVSSTELNQRPGSSSEQIPFPALDELRLSPESEEPLPSQFIRHTPWQDPVRGPILERPTQPGQPKSSNEAAYMFNQAVANWDSASRAATWGTGRQLVENEVNAVVSGSRVRHPSLAKHGSSIVSKARGLITRRSSSNIKKAALSPSADSQPMQPPPTSPGHRESISPKKALQRIPSFGKQKSPTLTTESAIMAMTGNLTAVGGGHSGSSPFNVEPEKSSVLRSPLNVLRTRRSKSDAGKSSTKSSLGLAELMRGHGGPPMPKLASPRQEHWQPRPQGVTKDAASDDNDNEDDDEVGVRMDLSFRSESIIPTLEGFKESAQRLNPRLEPYLINRLGQEQLKRYKKLLESKIQHTQAVGVLKKCSSGPHCPDLGGKAALLPPRVSAKDAESTGAKFQISSPAEGEVDDSVLEDGVVTPAQFPQGIPLPPVTRLPAQFECSLCYKVKQFHKPSDWTKHVHEDTQPFTCTFPNCSEPKSFKRKADWVRHENECHRRLEYWRCNIPGCSHECSRRDNFVQHLVREHKKTEPRSKTRAVSGSSKAAPPNPLNAPSQTPQEAAFWRMVDDCRHETLASPRDEPCRFCGNVCNSWKKLSVHLGKHLEQVALPVIEVVKRKHFDSDTAVSPIERNRLENITPAPHAQADHPTTYAMNAGSSYQGSSAGQSPAAMLNYSFSQAYRPQPLRPPVQEGGNYGNAPQYTTTDTGFFMPVSPQVNDFPMPASVTSPQQMPSYTLAPSFNPYASTHEPRSFPSQLEPNNAFDLENLGAGEYAYMTRQLSEEKQQDHSYAS